MVPQAATVEEGRIHPYSASKGAQWHVLPVSIIHYIVMNIVLSYHC